MLIVVADVETTGAEPPAATVCEVGLVWLQYGRGGLGWMGSASAPCRVVLPMEARARASHHLTPAMLRRARPAGAVLRRHWRPAAMVLVAHNAPFDAGFLQVALRSAGHSLPPLVVDTLRCAKHLWPNAPGYALQVLRYHLGLRVRPPGYLRPHRALYDALVCAALLRRMLAATSLERLVYLSTAPVLQATVQFGQHRGTPWNEVPWSYLTWMGKVLAKDPLAFDGDARYTSEVEAERRRLS